MQFNNRANNRMKPEAHSHSHSASTEARTRYLFALPLLGALFVCCGGSNDPVKSHTGAGGKSAGGSVNDAGGTTVEEGGSDANGGGGASSAGGSSLTASGGATATATTGTPNLFTSLLNKTQAEVDVKVTTAVNRYFGIETDESTTPTAATGYRCYYELPQSSDMAFIWAADSDDIRSEGMSYGMMIAAQMGLQPQFDKLWTFAKTYMQYPDSTPTTAWKYYFRWRGTVNRGSATNWTVTFNATAVPAPDGDEYFAAALYLADKRWGSSGTVNYKLEADNIADAMLHNTATDDGRYPLFHTGQNMAVFVPMGGSNGFTDPSYHLPAFYEMFALYGPTADSAKWKTIATTSRNFLVSSANATTGLHPDYATFAGAPTTATSGDGHDKFQYDAWRVVMNMGVDYAWFSSDAQLKAQAEKYHAFFASYLTTNNVTNSLFAVNGSGATGGGSTALTATLAAGALASAAANRTTYVSNLWGVAQQSGQYRYYQEGVYLLGLLAVAGKFNYSW